MVEVKIIKVPYFGYEVMAWDSWLDRNRLNSENPRDLLKRLENGENLFKVIPNFTQKHLNGFKFKYAQFEERGNNFRK